MPAYVWKALFVFAGLLILWELTRLLPELRRPVPRALVHAVMGLVCLLTGNALGSPFGLGIGLNALTLPVSAGLGAPGVALLWAVRYLL